METIFPKTKYLYTDEIIKARNHYHCGKNKWNKMNGNLFTLPYNRPDTCFGKRKEYFLTCQPGLIYIHTSNTFVSHIPSKIPLDKDFGFLVGIYLAEGWCTNTFVGVSNKDKIIRNRVEKWCDKYGITYHLVKSNSKNIRNGKSYDLKLHSTLLARMLKKICQTGSENKEVPLFSYQSNYDFLMGMIDGYFSGDGTVNNDGVIIASSASEKLIHGISFILSLFNIYCVFNQYQVKENNIGSKNIKKSYTLYISSGYARRFAETFTFTLQEKQERLTNILNINTMYKRNLSQKDFDDFDDCDSYFDKITKIDFVDSTTPYVYDLTVAKTRNFNLFSNLGMADTFHKAGQSEKSVTVGVPRFSELLNATKTPKMVNCKIYFNDGNESVHDLRETIAHKLVHITLKNLIKSIKICMNKEEEVWYSMFKILYNSNFSEHLHCISIKLDNKIMFKYRLTIDEIAKQIESKYSDLCCVFSPPDINQLDIFVDVSNIQFTQKQLLFITPDNAQEIYLDECVQPLLEGMTICGIYGIQNIYYTQENDEWFVETDGSNFKKILGCSIVDMTRTISNNVWDIYEVLGIEAAREFLISEFVSIMDGINLCHVKLLVDKR